VRTKLLSRVLGCENDDGVTGIDCDRTMMMINVVGVSRSAMSLFCAGFIAPSQWSRVARFELPCKLCVDLDARLALFGSLTIWEIPGLTST
jgi:hypothetical protein